MIVPYITIIFIGATLIQIAYWLGLFYRLAFHKASPQKGNAAEPPISIIICAYNEAENLENNLPLILSQIYRSYEVLVVNDHSTDHTQEVLETFAKKYPYIRIINFTNTKKDNIGKKLPLSKGIEAARYDTVLLTDADCRPASQNWLKEMSQPMNIKKTQVGLGYAPYDTLKGILNAFIRFETVYTAVQYLSFAKAGLPYMGVGRNLIYNKELYFKAGGFNTHEHIPSGDDDLFINQVATAHNTVITLTLDSFVYSEPKTTWRSYFRQKSRHLSTGTSYKPLHQLLLGLLSASQFLHYALAIILLCLGQWYLIFTLYLVRMTIVLIGYHFILKKLNDQPLWKWIPLLDAALVCYYILFAPMLFFTNRNTWK